MSESWLEIVLGIILIILSFVVTGVSTKAWPGGKIYPPTRKLRIAIFVIGVLALILGTGGLLHNQ